jgi:hypothetical protein
MDRKIKIMVGSTVYGFENELYQIVALLYSMGYEVLNSHVGTIKVNPNLSNLENCLNAVDECDIFLGIIRTNRKDYRTGCRPCKRDAHFYRTVITVFVNT